MKTTKIQSAITARLIRFSLGAAVGVAAFFATGNAQASAYTWSGPTAGTTASPTSGTWTTGAGADWNNGTAYQNWTAGNDAIFGGTSSGAIAITVGGGINANTLQFTSTTDNYTLSAGSAQTIAVASSSYGSATGGVRIGAGVTATIGTNVNISNSSSQSEISGTTASAAGGTLNLSGTYTAANNLVIDGVTVNLLTGGVLTDVGTIFLGYAGDGATLNLNGGNVTNGNNLNVGSGDGTAGGTDILNVNASATLGTVNVGSSTNAPTAAQVFLNTSGNLSATSLVGSNNSSLFFTGGALTARQAGTPFTGFTNVYVGGVSSGSTINNAGFAITVAQNLLTGAGVTGSGTPTSTIDGGLTFLGTGTTTISAASSTFTGNVVIGNGIQATTVSVTNATGGLNPTSSGLGNPQTVGRTITVNSGSVLSFSHNDSLGNATTVPKVGLIINGGTVNSNSSILTLGAITLENGATLNGGGAGYHNTDYDLGSTVTVLAGSNGLGSFISNTGTASTSLVDLNVGTTTFNVAQTGAAVDLTVSSILNDGLSPNTNGLGGGTVGSLTKTGAGTMLLTAANTYTGATTVSGGILQLTAANSSAGATLINAGELLLSGAGAINSSSGITVNGSGAEFLQSSSVASTRAITLTLGTVAGVGTVGNITVASSASNIITNGITGNTTGTLAVGTLTFSGLGTVDANLLNSNVNQSAAPFTATSLTTTGATVTVNTTGALSIGAYNIINFGSETGALGTFVLGTDPGLSGRESAALALTASSLVLNVTGDFPVWSGANGSTWAQLAQNSAYSGAGNWALNTNHTATDFWQYDTVQFNDTYNIGAGDVAVTNTTVNISSANVQPNSVVFGNSAVNYTLTGAFGIVDGTGPTSLTKNGTGTVTIQAPNAYTGGTIINNGTLIIGSGGTLGATTSALTVNNTNTLAAGNASLLQLSTTAPTTTGSLSGAISTPTSGVNTATIDNGGQLFTVNQTAPGTFAGVIQGAGGFALGSLSTSTLTLSGTNTFSGGTTVNGGTLTLASATALPTTGAVNVSNLNTGVATAAVLNLASTATTTLGSLSGTLATASSGTNTATINIVGGDNLTVNQTTSNSFAGTIAGTASTFTLGSLSTGTLTLTGNNTYTGATTISAGTLAIGGAGVLGAGSYAGNIENDAAFLYNGSANQTLSGVVSGAGSITDNGAGTLTLSGLDTFTNGPTIGTGATLAIGGAGDLGNSGGSGNFAANIANSGTFSYGSSANQTLSGVVSGLGALNATGSGTLTLIGLNTYSGGTTIGSGAKLTIGGAGDLGNSGGSGTYAGAINITGTFNYNSSAAQTFSGPISGTGAFNDGSANTVILSGNDSGFSANPGNVSVTGGGTLILAHAGSFYNGGAPGIWFLNGGSTVQLGDATGGINSGSQLSVNSLIFLGNGQLTTGSGGGSTIGFTNPNGGLAANGGNTNGAIQIASGATASIGAGVTVQTGFNLTVDTTTGTAGGILNISGSLLGLGNTTVQSFDGVTVNVLSGGTLSGRNFQIALWGTDSATIDVEGGTLSATSIAVGNGGTNPGGGTSATVATLIIGGPSGGLGGTVTSSGTMSIGATNNITALVDLNSTGSLTVPSISGASPNAALFYNGGTLISSGSSTSFISLGAGKSYVGGANGSGGAVINIGTFADKISTALLTGKGVTGSTASGNTGTTTDGGLTVNGTGTLTLSGANTYTGGTTVSSTATVATVGAGTLGAITGSLSLGAGTLDLEGTSQTVGSLTGTGIITNLNTLSQSNVTSTITAGQGDASSTFAGSIKDGTGSGDFTTLVKTGSGTLTLTGQSQYSDGTTISGGVLSISSENNIGNASNFFATTAGYTPQITLGGGELLTTANTTITESVVLNTGTNTLAASTGTTATYSGNSDNSPATGIVSGTGNSVTIGDATHHGNVVFTNPSTYTGTTAVVGGTLYVNNTSGSGTGSGAVSVGVGDTAGTGTLAGSGNITTSSGVTINGGGTLASGDAQSGTSVDGTHLKFTDTQVTMNGDAPAVLSISLGSGTTGLVSNPSGGKYNFSNPDVDTTYMTLAGSAQLNFALNSIETVALTDLTTGSLSLRQGTPYLLVQAGSNSAYTNLITASGFGANTVYSIDGNGYVVGVLTSAGLANESLFTGVGNASGLTGADYNAISITQYGPDGVTPLTGSNIYVAPALYLNNGDLEVVPEPGTWALMLGGLALLFFIQRSKHKEE